MVMIDMRCQQKVCASKTGIYRMVGRCANCKTEDILFLVTEGHKAPSGSLLGARCPVCGCDEAYAQRLATDDEIPVG